MDTFNPEGAVAVMETEKGTSPVETGFNVESAVPLDIKSGNTAYEDFKESASVPTEVQDTNKPTPPVDFTKLNPQNPTHDHNFLNSAKETVDAFLTSAYRSTIETGANIAGYETDFEKPGIAFKKTTGEARDVEAKIIGQHDVAAVVGGVAPFIISVPLFAGGLVAGGTALGAGEIAATGSIVSAARIATLMTQFGLVEGVEEAGRQSGEKSLMNRPDIDKAKDVVKSAAINAATAPIWAYADELKFIGRPVATALAQAGVRGAGGATMEMAFGNNLAEAFKQGGLLTALSLICEVPSLAHTVLGRGTIAHSNELAKEKGIAPINIESSPEQIRGQVVETVKGLSKDVQGANDPHIVAATVRLPDGTEIHGTSHEDALQKIGLSKNEVDDKKLISEVKSLLGDSEASQTIKTEDGYSRTGTGWPSFLSNKGYTRDQLNNIFDKFLNGEKLTEKQQSILDSIKEDAEPFRQSIADVSHYVKEDKDFKAGFTVSHPDGTFEFISREEAMKAPYNIKDGISENVPGLNEQKHLTPSEGIKIVNPKTLMGNESGRIDAAIIPGVTEGAELLKRSYGELQNTFVPASAGKEGKSTGAEHRANLGFMARNLDRMGDALSGAKKLLDKATIKSSLDFMEKFEKGEAQETPALQKIADVLRSIDDQDWERLTKTGKVNVDKFIEDHLPHYWDRPGKMAGMIKGMLTRRPWEGAKSFAKKRSLLSVKSGIEAGFTPASYNPVDFIMWRHREVEKFIAAHNTKEFLKDSGLRKFVKVGGEVPPGWKKINDKSEDVVSKGEKGELVIRGAYWTQPDAARIIDNYLSPGLQGKYFYQLYRGAGNVLNQFQLGMSAFHLGFTTMDATVSTFALGINKLSTGNLKGFGEIGKSLTPGWAAVENLLQGRKLAQAWYGKDMGQLYNTIADLMAAGGGRAKMDKFYSTGCVESMNKAFKEGKILTGVLKAPFAMVQKMSQPIMEYLVPRQKMGVFANMMKWELEQHPDASYGQMRDIAQKAWDSVDNRMGQLVYDNLFWNKTVKDVGMASVRSLGWNIGTIRELGGGIVDIGGTVRGKGLSYRTAYVLALPAVAGLYGSIYQYLHTGMAPGEGHEDEGFGGRARDLFFPRTGGLDKKGEEARVSLPSYMKDVYHYTTNPVQTVINKFSPVNNVVLEMLANKDFYGTEIRNVDDPFMQQALSELGFIADQFVPFSIKNIGKDTRETVGSKVEPFFGIVPAPYDVNMTGIEREANEMMKSHIPPGTRTKEQAEHNKNKSDVRNKYLSSGKDSSVLNEAIANKTITPKERKEIVKDAAMTPLQRSTQHLTFEEVSHLYKKAEGKEKEELGKILKNKIASSKKEGTWNSARDKMYRKDFENESGD